MHRLPVQTDLISRDTLEARDLSPAAAAHLRAVRPKEGERVELFDGHGLSRVFRFGKGSFAAVAGAVSLPRRSSREIFLFACITKGQRWDWTIAKATELGVSRIVPVLSARTIVHIPCGERAAKRERWLRIAEDAARQSGAAWLPDIDEAVPFDEAVRTARGTACFAGIIADPPPPPVLEALRRAVDGEKAPEETVRPVSLFVGPEGDFSPEERDMLGAFAIPCSFGPSILRAETAAIFGLSVLTAFYHGLRTRP